MFILRYIIDQHLVEIWNFFFQHLVLNITWIIFLRRQNINLTKKTGIYDNKYQITIINHVESPRKIKKEITIINQHWCTRLQELRKEYFGVIHCEVLKLTFIGNKWCNEIDSAILKDLQEIINLLYFKL